MHKKVRSPCPFSKKKNLRPLQICSIDTPVINPIAKQETICLLRLCQINLPRRPCLSAMVLLGQNEGFALFDLALPLYAYCLLFGCRINMHNSTSTGGGNLVKRRSNGGIGNELGCHRDETLKKTGSQRL